jgi:hypothetical protein
MNRRLLIAAFATIAIVLASCGTSGSSSDTTTASTATTDQSNQHVFEEEHFAAGAIVGDVITEDCTLNGGTKTSCARVTIAGYPVSYKVGPFCPDTITTTAKDAGIWFDGSGVYDLDGKFITNLADFYDDTEWKLYDSKGNVNVTDTQEAFEGAARPDVEEQYQNHCVEGQLAWLTDGKPIKTTMQIPISPVKASKASSAHPGNFGITLDGVVIAESAPVDAILGAHTIAAFDDCGGHYNPAAGYHLHGVTGCGQLVSDTEENETAMFGYAADGYPIHLPLTDAALRTVKLDECNGHSTASEGYHYHANNASKNAILPCLMGEYVSSGNAGGAPAGGPPAMGAPAGGPPTRNAGIDVPSIAVKLGVTVHELEDALVTGDIETAAKMLRTTSAVIAKKLGVSVADLQTAFAQTTPK